MPTIKKTNKSMAFQKESSNDLEKAKKAISNGAILKEEFYCGKKEIWVCYNEGGRFKITNSVAKKISI